MKRSISRRATRVEACRLAAQVMQGQGLGDGLGVRLWSATVFFECYIDGGAAATKKDFGPKKPVKLKVAKA